MSLKSVSYNYEYKGMFYTDLYSVVVACGNKVKAYKVNDIRNTVSEETIYELDKKYFRIISYVNTACPCLGITLDGKDGYFSTEKKAKQFLVKAIQSRIEDHEKLIKKLREDICLIKL